MKIKGIAAGLLIGLSVTASAGVIDTSTIRASIIKAGVVASGVIGNPFGGAVADFFALNFNLGTIVPETTETITTSFTRATPTSVETADGAVVQLNSGEAGFAGARRVENLLPFPEDLENAGWSNTNVTVTSGVSDPDGGSTAFTLTADAASAFLSDTITVSSADYRNSIWIKRRTGTGNISVRQPDGTDVVVSVTGSWQRFSPGNTDAQSGTTLRFRITIATSGDEVDVWHPQAENVTDKPHKAPSEYVSVGVGVQPDILTSAITASDWTATGNNTIADNGDGSIRITYVDNTQGGSVDLGALYPVMEASTLETYVVEYQAKVNTGAVNVASFNATPSYAQSVDSTSFVTYTAPLIYDGSGNLLLFVNGMGASEYIDIEILSIRKADHGANIDAVKYFNTWNPRYVDSNNVVQNDSATGAAISNTTASFANLPGASGSYYSQADSVASSITDDITLIAYAAPESWGGSDQSVLAKHLATGSQVSYRLSVSSDRILFRTSSDGSTLVTSQSDTTVSFADGEGAWIRVSWDQSTNTAQYFTSSQDQSTALTSISWVQLGSDVTHTDSGIYDGTAAVEIGSINNGTGNFYKGRVYRAHIISGLDETATPVVTFDPNDTTGWTANGNAYITTPPLNPDGDGPAGLQVAAASTNLATYSEDRTNAAWTATNVTVDADAAVAPDGTVSMDRINVDAGIGTHLIRRTSAQSVTVDTDYTYSEHLADDGVNFVQMFVYGGATDWASIVINTQTLAITQTTTGAGTMSLTSSGVVVGADGRVRAWMKVQDSANTTMLCHLAAVNSATPTQDAIGGNVTWSASGGEDFFAWGAQFEQGTLGPYVKTVASSQARNAEVGTYSGLSLTTNSGHITVSDIGAVDGETYVRIDDGTANNYVRAYLNGSAQVQLDVYSGGVAQAQMTSTTTFSAGDDIEIAWRVAEDDMALLINGSQEATDTSGSVPATMDDVDIGHNAGTVAGTRNIGSLQLFDTAKSNAELSAL